MYVEIILIEKFMCNFVRLYLIFHFFGHNQLVTATNLFFQSG